MAEIDEFLRKIVKRAIFRRHQYARGIISVRVTGINRYKLDNVVITNKVTGDVYDIGSVALREQTQWISDALIEVPGVGDRYLRVKTKPGEVSFVMPGTPFTVKAELAKERKFSSTVYKA